MAKINVLAGGLKIHMFQGVAEFQGNLVVPTLDSHLVQISPDGAVSTWVQFCEPDYCGGFGAPFGIANYGNGLVVTVSSYSFGGQLILVTARGQFRQIADLTEFTRYGGLFGVTVDGDDFIVAVLRDLETPDSLLMRVTPNGQRTVVAELSTYGIPLDVIIWGQDFILTQEQGMLVRVTPQGTVEPFVNLKQAGWGIPIGVTTRGDNLVVSTNSGKLVQVDRRGQITLVSDLLANRLGIASGVINTSRGLITTTTGGIVVQVNP